METKKIKTDKSVTKLQNGKIRLKINELEFYEMRTAIQETLDFYNKHPWKKLTVQSFNTRAIIALMYDLLKKLSEGASKITLTRTEAELFWGAISELDKPVITNPSLTALLGKLHQKLS